MDSLPQVAASRSSLKVVSRRSASQAGFVRLPLRRATVDGAEAQKDHHVSAKAERPKSGFLPSATPACALRSSAQSASTGNLKKATERSRSSTTRSTAVPSPEFSPASSVSSRRSSKCQTMRNLALPTVGGERSRPLSGSSRSSSRSGLSRGPSEAAPFGSAEAVRVPSLRSPQQTSEGLSPEILRFAFARNLARRHNIATQEVQRVVDHLDSASGGRNCGLLDLNGLLAVLRATTGHSALSERSVASVWEASTASDHELDMDVFLSCYVAEKRWTHVKESTYWVPSEAALRELARKLCVPTRVIEKAYSAFEQIGGLCLPKFRTLLQGKASPRGRDVSEERILSLWRELHADGSGEVDFPEFAPWYLRHSDACADA
mmetsp:Transcript_48970/g.129448  ORF Transcript_48970/g.129448 Transcript_48970/m.129448 type:complete len:377 (-) Transcript_48970:156-1286(-)